MIDFQLLRCGFGNHNTGEPINDTFHGWIKVCHKCGHIIKIPKPDGLPIDA